MNEPMGSEPDVWRRAEHFLADDPDPETRAELSELLAKAKHDARLRAELEDRFAAPLTFGTAGLRGLIGAGDNRMNRRVVARTTAALCAQLLASVPDAARRGLCIGFDGRHKSLAFADEVQAVANGAGFVVHAFEMPAPTPLLAFAVRACGAAAGVMVTASHNPAAYNGYKVYWDDGAQLNTPHDAAIAQRIADGPQSRDLPRLSRAAAQAAGLWHSLAELPQRYFSALGERLRATSAASAPRVAYTALHGVGEHYARTALQLAGVSTLASVAEQATADPNFPTVRFPNPEEPGALDRLLELARVAHAELALANDPDADRLAAAVLGTNGELQALSGNELGVLLCDYLLAISPKDRERFIVTTIVSTPLAEQIARAHGARAETTLTGFKWIVRRALERQAEGLQFVIGFEEALGYCIGDLVRDKDGIGAAAHVAQMAAWHAERGQTLWQALEGLYVRHGLWESRQVSIALSGPDDSQRLRDRLERLRRQPPTHVAGKAVSSVRDLLYGPNPDKLPQSDVFVFELDGGHRVTIRPSGTEPKLKLYLDCTEAVTSAGLPDGRKRLAKLSDELTTAVRALL
jgi:phosphomannomutase